MTRRFFVHFAHISRVESADFRRDALIFKIRRATLPFGFQPGAHRKCDSTPCRLFRNISARRINARLSKTEKCPRFTRLAYDGPCRLSLLQLPVSRSQMRRESLGLLDVGLQDGAAMR